MAVLVLLFTFGTVVAMGLPIVTAIVGLVMRPVDHHAAQPGGRGPDRRADAGDDDRPGRRDRLRAVHRHAPPGAAARRAWTLDESIARVDGDVGRRGRVRRDDGDRRAAVAGGRRHPARHDARLHGGARRRGRGGRRDHAAAGAARGRSATAIDRLALPHQRGRATTTTRTAGSAGRGSSRAARCRAPLVGARRPRRARAAGARPVPRPAGQRRAADEHRGAAARTTG